VGILIAECPTASVFGDGDWVEELAVTRWAFRWVAEDATPLVGGWLDRCSTTRTGLTVDTSWHGGLHTTDSQRGFNAGCES